METLESYFLYEKSSSNIKNIFENLSRQLKIIHSHGMTVSNISSNSIILNGDNFSFQEMERPMENEFESEKKRNIVTLAKMMIGAYLSVGNGYRDFSQVDDKWFINNIEEINSAIIDEGYDKSYYSQLFNGSFEYYSDYLDRMKQNNSISGKENVNKYAKVLRTSSSNLYEDQSDTNDYSDIESKSASISSYFYPILIGVSILLTVSLSIFINVFNK